MHMLVCNFLSNVNHMRALIGLCLLVMSHWNSQVSTIAHTVIDLSLPIHCFIHLRFYIASFSALKSTVSKIWKGPYKKDVPNMFIACHLSHSSLLMLNVVVVVVHINAYKNTQSLIKTRICLMIENKVQSNLPERPPLLRDHLY